MGATFLAVDFLGGGERLVRFFGAFPRGESGHTGLDERLLRRIHRLTDDELSLVGTGGAVG